MEYKSDFLHRMFATYFGCNVIRIGHDLPSKMISVNSDAAKLLMPTPVPEEECWFYFNKLELMLSPYSEMTVAHRIQVANMASEWDRAAPLDAEDVPMWLEEVLTGNCATMADYVSGRQMQQLIDLLRKLGYDMGFEDVESLIKSGFAVEKKEEPTE